MSKVKIKKTSLNGDGVFAVTSFNKGETVIVGRKLKELDANHSHASQISKNTFILHDEITRIVNHSCDPNCGIEVNSSGAHNYVAIKHISAGEEVSFDYAMRNYTIEHFPPICQCGAKQCREKITGWKDLPLEKKEEYRSWAAPYLLELELEAMKVS